MRVHLARTSPTHHRLEIVRADGSREAHSLETRSCLLHDLVHFALETEAPLPRSLFGRLAAGATYESLNHPPGDLATTDELTTTEAIVGPLQGAWKAGLDPDAFLAELRRYRADIGEPFPSWLDVDLLTRFAARMRQLEGWRATGFGDTMELTFAI